MRIGVDIDDVLADLNRAHNQFLFDHYGIVLQREQWTTIKFHELIGWDSQQAVESMKVFNNSEYLNNLVPVAGAVDGIYALASDHELILITARHEEIDSQTRSFLTQYFGDPFSGLHYTNYARHDGSGVSKASICLRENIELMIEDGPDNALGCAAAGISVLLFDTPWNRSMPEYPRITRVDSWSDISGIIKRF